MYSFSLKDVSLTFLVFDHFLDFSDVVLGFRLDFPREKKENPGPGQILRVSYPIIRVHIDTS